MNYKTGKVIHLGDIVRIDIFNKVELARVVMLGVDYSHLNIDIKFIDWIQNEKELDSNSIIVEWVNENPLKHNKSEYAPVGNYLFTSVDEDIELVERA